MKNWEGNKTSYKKLWSEIKMTDPWRYDLDEDFYRRMHDGIMQKVVQQQARKEGRDGTTETWWTTLWDWKSWRSWKKTKQ